MKRIFIQQSKLRLLINCKCDLTGYEKVSIHANKPDGTSVTFPATVKDIENGIIFYDLQTEEDINNIGWWTFWPEILFDDDRKAFGKASQIFVSEPFSL